MFYTCLKIAERDLAAILYTIDDILHVADTARHLHIISGFDTQHAGGIRINLGYRSKERVYDSVITSPSNPHSFVAADRIPI